MSVDLFGLDAMSEVAPAAQHQVGSRFMIRYLSRYTPKVVTRAEYAAYQANGIYLALVFEDGATNALGGYDQGKADAEFAKRQAIDILGQPSNPTPMISFAVDFDPNGGEARTDAYFDGAAAVFNRAHIGPYGSFGMCAHAHARGFQSPFQTYAWSGGQFFQPSKLYQYSNNHTVGGVGVDFDKAFDLSAFWNHKTQPVDPHGYLKFDSTPREIVGNRSERYVVERYDVLRAKQGRVRHPHRKELARLRQDCHLLAQRIQQVAMASGSPVWGNGDWTSFHRTFRYRGLDARFKGQRVV